MKSQGKPARVTAIVSFLGLLCQLSTSEAQPAAEPMAKFWRPDGPVYAITVHSNTVYIGGQFSYVGPWTGGAGIVGATTGVARRGFPEVDGVVYSAVPDSQGGWFIGGSFRAVGGVTRSNLAHIRVDLTVDPNWNPSANNSNAVMLVQGSILYIGGAFTQVAGQTRNRLAALDTTTGALLTWNPNANGVVNSFALSEGILYVGGNFTTISGKSRGRLAAVDAATGAVGTWNPGASTVVNAVAVSGTTVFAGGTFTTAGTKPRNRIAAFDIASDVALDWNPNANAAVNALVVSGNTVYVAGQFTNICGVVRKRLAAVDATTFQATAWDPGADDIVNMLVLSGNTMYVGGAFGLIGGQPRNTVAALDATTGNLMVWEPSLSALLQSASPSTTCLGVNSDEVFFGSTFSSIGGVIRSNIAALDIITGEVTGWNPGANSTVRALAAVGGTLYVGGTFTTIGGLERRRLAALDVQSGIPASWNPNVLGRSTVNIYELVSDGTRLYVGGNFTNILATTRQSVAAVDLNTGELLTWDPSARASSSSSSASVTALIAAGDVVYAGGDFVTIGQQSRSRLAALDTGLGLATDWNPGAANTVYTLALSGTNLYVGGLFTTLGGLTRGRIGAVSTETGVTTPWNPDAGATTGIEVRALALAGQSVYAGGKFSQLGGNFRKNIGGISVSTGLSHSWSPTNNLTVYAICPVSDLLLVGGEFTTVKGNPQAYFAAFSMAPAIIPGTVALSGGQFTATLRTGEGQRVITQRSSDLVEWTSIATNIPAGSPIVISDTASANAGYYRAILESD